MPRKPCCTSRFRFAPDVLYVAAFALAAVAAESPRGGELAQPVPDHLLGHEHLDVNLAVVDHEGMADEIRHDRAGPGPGLDRVLRARRVLLFDLGEELGIDEGTFFQRSTHVCSSLFSFNWPYRRDRRRRTIALLDGL